MATFDDAVRRFLNQHPDGTVAALGEGLETQFWRLDNGRMRWLSVDLPAVLDLRRRVLPEGPRQRSCAGSALDLGWLDELDPRPRAAARTWEGASDSPGCSPPPAKGALCTSCASGPPGEVPLT